MAGLPGCSTAAAYEESLKLDRRLVETVGEASPRFPDLRLGLTLWDGEFIKAVATGGCAGWTSTAR